jgi:hypothetical protein
VSTIGRDKPRVREAENELVCLAIRSTHLQPASFVTDSEDDARLGLTPEVLDADGYSHTRERS